MSLRISESTSQAIMDAARKLGYRPNALTHSSTPGKSQMIARHASYITPWNMIGDAVCEVEMYGYTVEVPGSDVGRARIPVVIFDESFEPPSYI